MRECPSVCGELADSGVVGAPNNVPAQHREMFSEIDDGSSSIVHLINCYPTAVDQREEFQTFSKFYGIKKELDPCWDKSVKAPLEDWAGGKCGVALPLLKQALLPALKKYDYRVVNIWGGGNINALALVSSLLQNPSRSPCQLPPMCCGIGSPPIPVASH